MTKPNLNYLFSSFRDPSGYLFKKNDKLYRQINQKAQIDYDLFIQSGLYDELIKEDLIIPHQETEVEPIDKETFYKVIQPEKVDFISYPYEWSFSQYKDAALATLKIQKIALKHKMSLKDASSYNIQFYKGQAVLIDTLSFEKLPEGKPWIAYRQFCQHFLAPLVLMSQVDIRLSQLMRVYIDGIPIDLASNLLPFKSRLSFGVLTHIHLHAQSQKHFESKSVDKNKHQIRPLALLGIIDSLESTVSKLRWQPRGTEWAEYYDDTNYTDSSFKAKIDLVDKLIDQVKPKTVWDLGANDGTFSRLASDKKIPTIAFDIDPAAVEKGYRQIKKSHDFYLLPLVQDLTNPSAGVGWENLERDSLISRGPADLSLALALIHHLSISNNLPFAKVAEFFAKISQNLIIEFVPKEDSQVQRLLRTREDIFTHYDQEHFEEDFKIYFNIQESTSVKGSKRIIYLMKKK